MYKAMCVAVLLVWAAMPAPAAAQGGDGSLRGTVSDQQGGAIPGVTVTATGPALISPVTAVSESDGTYRLVNLPPGTYTIQAELQGFTSFRREGILLRAGANFQVDVMMNLGTVLETITVTGDSPMLEVSRPSNVLNIDADFQKQVPVVEGKYWSDFLMMAPGVISRPHNDGSGRQNYFGNAVEHRDAVTLMEGMYAGNYNDFNINRTGLSSEAIQDTEIKTGGVDAASPMGYGLVINMISKSGGNRFQGSVANQYQPIAWNTNNVGDGTPATRQVYQYDFSLGGPVKRDRTWFFAALRFTDNKSGTGRTPELVAVHRALVPNGTLGDNSIRGFQPWAKVTTKLGVNHNLSGVYQADRLLLKVVGAEDYEPVEVLSTGGPMYGAKLTSVWHSTVTTTISASYNRKGGNSLDSYKGRSFSGPLAEYHREAFVNQGIAQGSGLLVRGGNWSSTACDTCYDLDTSSILMLRGDLTWYARDFAGTHDVQTGFLALPQNNFDKRIQYLNDGFIFEERRQINPNDPGAGTVPFHRQYVIGSLDQHTASGRDRDIGAYAQDTWKPTPRMTATLGLRVDFVRRYDALRDLVRQNSTEIAPRLGFSYLLTEDAKNVLRGSYVRIHQQLMGTRHPVAAFGGDDAAGLRDEYDVNGDGLFETVIASPPRAATISNLQFDPELHQPLFDEFTLGFRRQFPGQTSVDVAGIVKINKEQYAQVDINGIYPGAPFQPFGGFGRVDPNRGLLYRVTNNTWSQTDYRAVQITIAKNLTRGFQFLGTIHRQWQHLTGTWNPTDPARFIQPDAFANNRLVWRTDGMQDQNSLATGTTLTNSPMWNPYSIRLSAAWHAPAAFMLSANYTIMAGPYNGPVIDQLPASSPQIAQFGPATVVSPTGNRQPNPLATRIRFYYPTRGEGQVKAPDVHTVNVKIGRTFSTGAGRNLEVAANVFNLLNGGDYTEYARTGPNRIYNRASFLTYTNPQTPRALQLEATYRF
ncbi:MAG: TonB-dependent receptor [Acidobacteria bacterium]|nr:TonB-dependent receptor [Acidobacteriota bacterium]